MAHSGKNSVNFVAGDAVEVVNDVNCIPKGIYKFIGRADELNFFTLGDKIQFAISQHRSVTLKKVTGHLKHYKLTKSDDFLDRYYNLLDKAKNEEFRTDSPMTFCGLHPSLAREVN